jgi:hypothetical protein
MNSLDERALASSEIFREYLEQEQRKSASIKSKSIDADTAISNFENIQTKIKTDARLKNIFASLQNRFIQNPTGADPVFIDAVLSLNLE